MTLLSSLFLSFKDFAIDDQWKGNGKTGRWGDEVHGGGGGTVDLKTEEVKKNFLDEEDGDLIFYPFCNPLLPVM